MDQKLLEYATDKERLYCVALKEHGSIRKAAAALGVSKSSIEDAKNRVRARAARSGYAPDHDLTHPAPAGFRVKNVSTLYDKNGLVSSQRVSISPDSEKQNELLHETIEEMCSDLPKLPPRKKPDINFNKNLMNVIPWGDPHFGLHCWAEEVGNDFDLKIAKQDLCGAVDYLVSQAPPAPRCVIVNLGDFYHAENTKGVTERSGHSLDMDSRPQKIIRVGVAAIKQAISSALDKHETVEIVNAIGNHDGILSMALSVMLDNIYENEPRVIVHSQPSKRHYVLHDKVLIGVVHGDTTKDPELMGIMATEKPEWWGKTRHRVFMRGHHHQDRVQEFNGGKVEQFRTLSPGDAYAVGSGYLSGRDMKLITYHGQFGEQSRITCGIDLLRSLT